VGVPDQSAALLGLLMLRGPQTAGELRINTERWYRFADISSVEAFLEELAATAPPKKAARWSCKLPRAPGAREPRWAHLLCGAGGPLRARRRRQHQRSPIPRCKRRDCRRWTRRSGTH
jgi:uncharacterized protein YceH (UPF0502 family)